MISIFPRSATWESETSPTKRRISSTKACTPPRLPPLPSPGLHLSNYLPKQVRVVTISHALGGFCVCRGGGGGVGIAVGQGNVKKKNPALMYLPARPRYTVIREIETRSFLLVSLQANGLRGREKRRGSRHVRAPFAFFFSIPTVS